MRLYPRGEFLQEELDNAHLGIGSTTVPPPLIPLGKAKASARCVHGRILVFSPFLGFRPAKMPGLQDRVGGGRWEEGEGEEEGERKALWREESRDQRAEELLLRRGHKGHKPAKGREGCFSMPVRKKVPGSGLDGLQS